MKLRTTWRRISTLLLIAGAVAALLSTRGVFEDAPQLGGDARGAEPPAHLAPLARSLRAWQEATPQERSAYVGWLAGRGLEARRAALTAWIEERAEARGIQASSTLTTIFIVLACTSLLLVLLPLFVGRARAPHRVRLWVHALLAAVTLSATFLLLMVGLSGLMMATTSLSQNANPEQGLIDAAFATIREDAEARLAPSGAEADDALPYGPVVGSGTEGYEGGFLANILRSLRYFDPQVFEPAIAWTQRAWALLGFLPFVVPFLVALVFLLTMRPTLGVLLRWPIAAGRGVEHTARHAFATTARFIGRELLAILLLILVLIGVSVVVQVGVRLLSHQLVTLVLTETRTTVEYFGRLSGPPAQGPLTLGVLAPAAYLLLATLAAAGGLGLFALQARRRIQRRLHEGPRRRRFWRPMLFALFRLQWIPVLLLWVLVPGFEALHRAPIASADDALGRLLETAAALAATLTLAFFLFGGWRALLELLGLVRADPPPTYGLRPSTESDARFLRRVHHEALGRWIEPVYGWDETLQDRLVAEWLTRHEPQVVTLAGEDAGYLLVEDDDGAVFLHAVALLPSFQGRGVGTRLVEDVVAAATARGLPVHLRVLRPNPARRLYERLGFEVSDETETHYVMVRRPAPAAD